LAANLHDLSDRLQRGAYHARPGERGYSPPPDGRQRPSGIPTLEEKSVQRAPVEGLNAIAEEAWRGFASGLRAGRSPHAALDAGTGGSEKRNVHGGLEADSRGVFEARAPAWLLKCVAHRLGDPRVGRHIPPWVHAGVLAAGQWHAQEDGPPKGAG
jgi:retron-type reverse transcriptase